MIKTKQFIDDAWYDRGTDKVIRLEVDVQINDFLKNNNIRYIDVKYQMSSYGYADGGVNDRGTDTSALLIYEESEADD